MNLQNLKKIFPALFCCFLILGVMFTFTANITSNTSFIRALDGGLGLLETPLNQSQKEYKMHLKDSLLAGNIKVDAQFVVLDAAAQLARELLSAIVQAAVKAVLDFVKDKILDFLENVFAFIDDFIKILEKLADILSATRLSMAFLAFQSIQGDSNIQSSTDFALDMILQTESNLAGFDSFIGQRGRNTIIDTIAWLDFITIQKELQADTLGITGQARMTIEKILGISFDYHQEVRSQLLFVLSGLNCDVEPVLEATGPFGALLTDNSGCYTTSNSNFETTLAKRENTLKTLARQKVETFQERSPQDCKLRTMIKYNGGSSFNYSSGNLADSINEVADNIEVIIPTAEECQMATDGNKEKREISQKLFSEGNGAAAVTSSSGSVASVIAQATEGFIDTLIEELKNMFEDIKNQITERYGRILDLINRISNENNIGLQFIALDITVRIGSQLKNRLKELNESLQESLENDDGTSTEPSIQDVPPVDSDIPIFV